MAHDDLKAVGHEWHHCVRLQSPAPGDDAKPLERGAVTQCLEELGARTEVRLFQPAGINKKQLNGQFMPRKDTAYSWGAGKWIKQCLPPWRTTAQIGRKALNRKIPASTGSNPGMTLVLQVSDKVWWVREALGLSSRSILVLKAQPGFCTWYPPSRWCGFRDLLLQCIHTAQTGHIFSLLPGEKQAWKIHRAHRLVQNWGQHSDHNQPWQKIRATALPQEEQTSSTQPLP